jgi:uncharacterized protein YneF (UPF0154 family)
MNKNLKVLGIVVLLIGLAVVGWFLIIRQLQKTADKMQNDVESQDIKQSIKSEEQKRIEEQEKQKTEKVEKEEKYDREAINTSKSMLEGLSLSCEVYPNPNERIGLLEWCEREEVKKNPDCGFYWCFKGGKDLGNNYKLYKNNIYYYNLSNHQAGLGVDWLKSTDVKTFHTLPNNKYCDAKDKKVYYRDAEWYDDQFCQKLHRSK